MLISLIRTLLIYCIILVAVRIMGKRQISQLQTTELVVTLLISDLAVIPMQDSGQPLTSGLIPIFILIGCEVIASIIMLKNGNFRRLVCGKPVVVIAGGQVQQKELRSLRMSNEDLFEALRQKDIHTISEVKYALVETNGLLSVIKQEACETVQLKDLKITTQDKGIEVLVVSDGELCLDSLKLCEKTEAWVKNILKKEKVALPDVFILTAATPGNYTLVRRETAK